MKRILKYIRIILLTVGSVSLYSCIYEGGVNPPDPDDSDVRVALFTTGNDFRTPHTRAGMAQENAIGLPWVLVFDGDDNDATFVEARQAVQNGGSQYVLLSRKTTPSKLLLLVNPQDTFYAGNVPYAFSSDNFRTVLEGKSLAEACSIIRTEPLSSPQTVVPFAAGNKPIPMSAVWDIPQIVQGATIGENENKVQLERAVAKVIVRVDPDAYYFSILGATVVGVSQQEVLHNLEGTPQTAGGKIDYLAGAPADPVAGIAPGRWFSPEGERQYQSTEENPIYIYESAADWNAFVIVKGRFTPDSAHGQDYEFYIKLYFRPEGDSNPFAIKRNNEYIFNIKAVNSAGHPTLQEAIDEPLSQMNVWYSVTVNELSAYEMTYNWNNNSESYYLGVSNSLYEVYAEGALTNLNIGTVITNGTGATTSVNRIEVSEGLTLVGPAGGAISLGSTATDIVVNMDSGVDSGKVRVFYGSCSQTIDIIRKSPLTAGQQAILYNGYQMAKVESGSWLSLSQDGINVREDSKLLYANGDPSALYGGTAIGTNYYYYLHATANDGTGIRSGVVYTTKVNNQGRRIKMDIRQNR